MAQCVIHTLEAIEVDEQQRESVAATLDTRDGLP